jgi:two-component system, response regulator PdtaR
MILLGSYFNPPKLWLAAAASQANNSSEEQGNEPGLGMRSLRVLIVEDEFFISLHIKQLVQTLGHSVVAIAVSADEAVNIAEIEQPDVVLMDIRLIGPRDGIDAAEEIRRRFGIDSIFVTANTDPQTRQRAQAVQPLGFLEKPLTEQRLRLGLSRIAPH